MILERGEVEVWNNPRARKSTESVNYQMTFKPLSSLVAVCFFAALSAHAGSYVYPKNGQSAEQQQKDEYECHQWAAGQTGYDPVVAAGSTKTVDAGPAPGAGARGVVGGAATGAVIANIAGGSGSRGAAAGAVIGGVRGRARSRQQVVVEEQVSAADPAKQKQYDKVRAACLDGKGYSVK